MELSEEAEEELIALESIYGEEGGFQRAEGIAGGVLSLPIGPEEGTTLRLTEKQYLYCRSIPHLAYGKRLIKAQEEEEGEKEKGGEGGCKRRRKGGKYLLHIEHLPPVKVLFELPSSYPLENPPHYTLECPWLATRELWKFAKVLDSIWEANIGEVVLFSWTQWLTDEAFNSLKFKDCMRLFVDKRRKSDRVKQSVDSVTELLVLLVDYDRGKTLEEFANSYHLCAVCFEEKLGQGCIFLDECGHTFCRECLGGFANCVIQEGNVKGLSCPDVSCRKALSLANIQQLVSEEMFRRYQRLSEKARLDEIEGIEYCPRIHCQQPVVPDDDSNLCVCMSCSYAFCSLCKMTWHGIQPCRLNDIQKILDEYENGSEEVKKGLEKRYGISNILREKDRLSTLAWVKDNTVSCPQCKTNISKSGGCNKMTCSVCNSYFCWLCKAKLGADPYEHYKSGRCGGALFDGLENDANGDPYGDEFNDWDEFQPDLEAFYFNNNINDELI